VGHPKYQKTRIVA